MTLSESNRQLLIESRAHALEVLATSQAAAEHEAVDILYTGQRAAAAILLEAQMQVDDARADRGDSIVM
jgi:hypothetical protein